MTAPEPVDLAGLEETRRYWSDLETEMFLVLDFLRELALHDLPQNNPAVTLSAHGWGELVIRLTGGVRS